MVPPQVEALRGGDLFGARIGGERHRIGRLALAGRDFHHARRDVAVFGRRYAGHHLDRLDVGRRQVTCAGTRRVAQRSIGGKAYAVDLDGRTERRIAGRAPAAAQRKDIVLHQVGINRFATRQQCRDVRRIDHLQVVDGIAADRTRRSHGVGRLLGRHHDALQFQVILGGIKPDRPHPRTHVDLGSVVTNPRQETTKRVSPAGTPFTVKFPSASATAHNPDCGNSTTACPIGLPVSFTSTRPVTSRRCADTTAGTIVHKNSSKSFLICLT